MANIDPTLAQAVAWNTLLRSGTAGPADRADFASWRASHPGHDAAARRLDRALSSFDRLRHQGVSHAVVRQAMLRVERRRTAMKSFALGAGGLGVGVLGWRRALDNGLFADQRTVTAQRHQSTLQDGSGLWLDACTTVDVAFDERQRTLTLHRGRLLAEANANPAAPLVVRSTLASLQAVLGRFVVQTNARSTLLTVLEGSAVVRSLHDGGGGLVLEKGHSALITHGAPPRVTAANGTEALWTKGLIAMNDEPLGNLVEALRAYRPGVLRIDPDAARLHVSGMFSLDDTDRTLHALEQTQPVRVTRRTRYWVGISLA